MVHDIHFADDAQIFDGHDDEISLLDLLRANALRKHRAAESVADELFDGRNVVHLQHHVVIGDIVVQAFQARLEERARAAPFGAQDEPLFLQPAHADHALVRERVVFPHHINEIVGGEEYMAEPAVRVRDAADDDEVDLVKFEFIIKIFYGV